MTAERRTFLGSLPLLAALLTTLVITAAGFAQTEQSLGEFIYPIDDAYIHMAMARNLAQHGVYGVTPFEAVHASSSPLWVLLLSLGFLLLGPWPLLPFVVATLCGIAILLIAHRYLRSQPSVDYGFADLAGRGFVLCLIAIGGSLPAIALQGMEHALHAALVLLAAVLGMDAIARRDPDRRRDVALVLLCCVLPVLRYESIWVIGFLAMGLLWRRRFALAAGIAIAAALSVCAVGFWAMSHGLSFLPAPILTKSVGPLLLTDNGIDRIAAKLIWHPLWRLGRVPMLALLFLSGVGFLAVMLWRLRLAAFEQGRVLMVALFVGCTWVHATFATFGWGGRYEAYLIVLGTAAMGGAALDLRWRLQPVLTSHRVAALAAGLATALIIYTALGRAQTSYRNSLWASEEVLNRDVYVGRFLAKAYPGASVLAMNIGAVAWEGEPHLLDPVGLATAEIPPLIFARRYDTAALETIARRRDVQVFAIFDEWFEIWVGGQPGWVRVAQIDASNERRSLVLTLYARDESEGRILAERLKTVRPEGRFSVKLKLMQPFE